jgi:hypothetical protein
MYLGGRSFSSNSYRFGFNGQEKDNEITNDGEHNTALFWEYDSRLARRWNLDPKPSLSIGTYSTFSNNPLFYIDPLGDVVKGVSQSSGKRMNEQIQNSFKGENEETLRNLFKLGADGKTMAPINENEFVSAISGLSKDKQQLAV